MSGLPPASRSAFGMRSVRGRMRSPRPAARIMTFTGSVLEREARRSFAALEFVKQSRKRRERLVALRDCAGVTMKRGVSST